MKILHTSDWHLGRTLYGLPRSDEYEKFFTWLLSTIKKYEVELLLIAGDVFDNTTPSNRSQNYYYDFLRKATQAGCSDIVVIGGNHDSPTFLEAPKEILKSLNVHVVGYIEENQDKEIITIRGPKGETKLIVCAVPYLRDRDVRDSLAGESVESKKEKLLTGIASHYQKVHKLALLKQKQEGTKPPIICMGHLFAAGGKTVIGDGVRELYVGSLAHVPGSIFPASFDYVALGHLHSCQKVRGTAENQQIHYSGSPLPMSFSEAEAVKKVLLVSVDPDKMQLEEIPVPLFKKLQTLKGDRTYLVDQLKIIASSPDELIIWVEIIYNGAEPLGNLADTLEEITRNTHLKIVRIVNEKVMLQALTPTHPQESLENLSVSEVFEKCLNENNISNGSQKELRIRFDQIVQSVQEGDSNDN